MLFTSAAWGQTALNFMPVAPCRVLDTRNSGSGGAIQAGFIRTSHSIEVYTANATDLVVEINGYFAPPASGGLSLYTMPPCRALDTRYAPYGSPFSGTLSVPIANACGGAPTAPVYVVNASVVPAGALQYLSLASQGMTSQVVGTLNAPDGVVTNNLSLAQASSGSISASDGTGSTYLILDLFGYFAPTPPAIQTLTSCLSASSVAAVCPLPLGTTTVTQTLEVGHSNVMLTGASSDRTQSVLVRDPNFTGDLISVGQTSPAPVTGVTIQNLTVCGGGYLYNPSQAPACPAQPTSYTSSICNSNENSANPGSSSPLCVDLYIHNASTGLNPVNPFGGSSYSVTVSNVDLEAASGHGVAIYPNAVYQTVSDVHITNSAVNASAVTGILLGANENPSGPDYNDRKVCDVTANYPNSTSVPFPRNVLIEGTTFQYNNTGVIGGTARWLNLRNNSFLHDFINPQIPGNSVGGNVFLDQCTDTVQIFSNTMDGSNTYHTTFGLELWGRNIDVEGNTINNFPNEGIQVNSAYNVTIQNNNKVQNNDQDGTPTGGILVATRGPGGYCDQIPRDANVVSISSSTVTGQSYGIRLFDQATPNSADAHAFGARESISNLAVGFNNNVTGNPLIAYDDAFVSFPGYSGPTPSPANFRSDVPRALAVDVTGPWPEVRRCTSPGTDRATFTFAASDTTGPLNLYNIQAILTTAAYGPDGSLGPEQTTPPTIKSCHLLYVPSARAVYLDDQYSQSTWSGGSSPLGSGGVDLSNGYCTIHAGSSSYQNETLIADATLDIQFGSSLAPQTYIYEMTQNANGLSYGNNWVYWGYWTTP